MGWNLCKSVLFRDKVNHPFIQQRKCSTLRGFQYLKTVLLSRLRKMVFVHPSFNHSQKDSIKKPPLKCSPICIVLTCNSSSSPLIYTNKRLTDWRMRACRWPENSQSGCQRTRNPPNVCVTKGDGRSGGSVKCMVNHGDPWGSPSSLTLGEAKQVTRLTRQQARRIPWIMPSVSRGSIDIQIRAVRSEYIFYRTF